MEFRLRERPVFRIKQTAGSRRDRKVAEFLRKYSTGICFGGVSIGSGSSRHSNTVFYAEGENRIIGACSMIGYGRGLILCYNFSVIREFRRGGIGTALIKAVIDHARTAKIHNILILSEVSNKEGKKFLRKTGFRKVGKIRSLFNNKDYILWEYLP